MKKEKALQKAAALCSAQERCVSDIIKKLQEWECEETDIDAIISTLQQQKFLDDERYTQLFVKSKLRNNKWGRIKIEFTLKQKGVDNGVIQNALDSIDENEYFSTLEQLLQAKVKTIKARNDFDKKTKLFRFASAKGFEFELINKVVQIE